MLTNGLDMCLPLRTWAENIFLRVETQWLPGKENVPGAADRQEG